MIVRSNHHSRGFTLTELLVAIGVVAILTIGIGQIFVSVSSLVSTGSALAEVDQAARALEAQLRDDIEGGVARLPSTESCFVIRNREIGDINRNGSVDSDEFALFLRSDDEEGDTLLGVPAYGSIANDRIRSRAITTRLDEMMFVAFAGDGGQYTSYQELVNDPSVQSAHARVYWGHGLRPPLDDVDQTDPDDVRLRLYFADGDFGVPAGEPNVYAPPGTPPPFDVVNGRNQFASSFVLCRQPMLLVGGAAAGYSDINRAPLIGVDREYVPLIRDLETEVRAYGAAGVVDDEPNGGPISLSFPNGRIMRHGRSDICAQSLADVIRWVEGSEDLVGVSIGTAGIGDASAYTNGRWDLGNALQDTGTFDYRLWERAGIKGSFSALTVPNLQNRYRYNLRNVQSALAGMLSRPLVETEPPDLRADYSNIAVGERPSAQDDLMDAHAIFAERCSRFEIAWSDGTVWLSRDTVEVDSRHNDGVPERVLRPGDVIWFDMDFTVADLYEVLEDTSGLNYQEIVDVYPRPNPDPEVGPNGFGPFGSFPTDPLNRFATDRTHLGALNVAGFTPAGPDGRLQSVYANFWTGGVPSFTAGDLSKEYLAIFGFRKPLLTDTPQFGPAETILETDGYMAEGWQKPKLIRVRATLHDSQDRIDLGRTYEFVFRIEQESGV